MTATSKIELIEHASGSVSAGADYVDGRGGKSYVCSGFAATPEEAIGRLICSRPEVFGLEIKSVDPRDGAT